MVKEEGVVLVERVETGIMDDNSSYRTTLHRHIVMFPTCVVEGPYFH